MKRILLVMCVIMSLCLEMSGCTPFWKTDSVKIKNYEKKETVTSEESSEEPEKEMDWEDALELADDYLQTMTIEEKVGQLFVLNLEQLDNTKGDFYEHRKVTEEMRKTISEYHIGGVLLFSRNLKNRKQTIRLNRKLQKASALPLFIAVDEEGGDVARIASNKRMKTTQFPSAEMIGKTKDDEYTYQMAKTIGTEIGELGFNADFAPVADVKLSSLNMEIGTRSFGDDPKKVSEHVSAFVQGLHQTGTCAALKHFPGQGSSDGNTHDGSVDLDSGISKLRNVDFVPFATGISVGADFVMMSHISVSKVTESSVPASMSELMMKTILRDELGFEKIIITDAFDMASITGLYNSAEAAKTAIKAGVDIVLMPEDFEEAYSGVLGGIDSGEISQEMIDEAVTRILAVKIQRGIFTDFLVVQSPAPAASPDMAATPDTAVTPGAGETKETKKTTVEKTNNGEKIEVNDAH